MKLLVTGGAGYIGSVVTAQLLDAGHDVTVLDSLATGHRDAVPAGAAFVHGDIADPAVTGPLLARGVEGVLHFAAYSLVGESAQQPERYYENNVVGTFRLLEALRRAGTARLVFSSTAAAYGEPDRVPITEDVPSRPTNAYGATKLAIDQMIAFYCQAHGLGAASLRYFNVAGAYRGFGERHTTETHLIPVVLQVALDRRNHVQIYGTDLTTRPRTAPRSATTSTSRISAAPTCSPWTPAPRGVTGSTTSAAATGSASGRSSTPVGQSPATPSPPSRWDAAPATPPGWSPPATASAPTSAGHHGTT
jgi:UDP-glucose 4-epimerase